MVGRVHSRNNRSIPRCTFIPAVETFIFFSCFLVFLILLFMLPNNGCPTIFILVSKVGIDRTDSLGTGSTVVFYVVLSRWFSSTRQCDSSTVALDTCSCWKVRLSGQSPACRVQSISLRRNQSVAALVLTTIRAPVAVPLSVCDCYFPRQ